MSQRNLPTLVPTEESKTIFVEGPGTPDFLHFLVKGDTPLPPDHPGDKPVVVYDAEIYVRWAALPKGIRENVFKAIEEKKMAKFPTRG